MNKKAWWQKIKAHYPLTLADCRGFFEMRFREAWRTKMQLYTELLPYFQEKYIRIDLRPSYRKLDFPTFGYKLYANGIAIHRDPVFSERELAAFDALEFAFRIREAYLVTRQQTNTYPTYSRKRAIDIERKGAEKEKQTLAERNEQQRNKR